MLIKIRTSADLPYSDVTPEAVYRSRREFIAAAAVGAVGAVAGGLAAEPVQAAAPQAPLRSRRRRLRSRWTRRRIR